MAQFRQWFRQLVRRLPGTALDRAGAAQAAWHVAAPTDPTQPLWLVPAYQRRRQSGDRAGLR